MAFSERFLAGFALAATVAKDPAAAQAREGLADAVADAMTATARELSALDKAARRARVRALAEPPAHVLPSQPTGSARAFALLARKRRAADVPAWLRSTPLPRPGFTPEPQLNALLTRIAARVSPIPPETEPDLDPDVERSAAAAGTDASGTDASGTDASGTDASGTDASGTDKDDAPWHG